MFTQFRVVLVFCLLTSYFDPEPEPDFDFDFDFESCLLNAEACKLKADRL